MLYGTNQSSRQSPVASASDPIHTILDSVAHSHSQTVMCSRSLLDPLQIPSVLVEAEFALLDGHLLAILGHDILNGDGLVGKDLQMVRNQVPVFASGTLDQDRTAVVRLVRHFVARGGVASLTRERNLVHGRHLAGGLRVLGVLGVLGSGLVDRGHLV